MVQVAVGGGSQLQCSKADVIKCLVVNTESLISILHKLMNRKGSIVGLDNSVRNLRAGHHGVGVHDPVGEFFSYLGDQKCSHARASAATKRMCELETLKTIATFCLLPHHIKHAVHKLCTFCVVTLGPVVASTTLPKDKVVRPEDLAVGSAPDGVHGAGLEVDEDGPGDVLASAGLVVVNIDPLQLKVGGAGVASCRVDSMLVRDDLPELGSNLIAALAGLQVDDFPHIAGAGGELKVGGGELGGLEWPA